MELHDRLMVGVRTERLEFDETWSFVGRTTPAKAIGVADRAWTVAQLVDAALAVAPAMPTETPPDQRRKFKVIEGGKGRVNLTHPS